MKNNKRVTRRGGSLSPLLGAQDPRIRQFNQEAFDPRADEKEREEAKRKEDVEKRLRKLEGK